jgi:two-component system nitrate/nitrite sensor histidine kinase NarX
VARHIAATLRANEQTEHRRRLELLEERNAIARELHDSLAQSLSYLKIQVSRLQNQLGSTAIALETQRHRAELREGLNNAYRQLRELIATFRLKMEHPRLEDSLIEIAREFSRRGQALITLDHAGWQCTLNPNEQIHVMHIIREALNNAVKHARANHIAIRLRFGRRGGGSLRSAMMALACRIPRNGKTISALASCANAPSYLGGTLNLESPSSGGAGATPFHACSRHRTPRRRVEADAMPDDVQTILVIDDHPLMRKGILQLIAMEFTAAGRRGR